MTQNQDPKPALALTPRQAEIVRLYNEGVPYTKIAHDFGIVNTTVSYALRKAGIAPRGQVTKRGVLVLTPERIKILTFHYAHPSASNAFVARQLHVTVPTVIRTLENKEKLDEQYKLAIAPAG